MSTKTLYSEVLETSYDRILNDTAVGGATTIDSGVKYAVVCQMTVLDEAARPSSSYRFYDRSLVIKTASDR